MADNNPHGVNSAQVRSFQAYFHGWLSRQQSFLQQLLPLAQGKDAEEKNQCQARIIQRVLTHYQEYFEEKSKLAAEDIFLVFSPPWLSSFERALLWVAGFKPSMVLTLVKNSVEDLTEFQSFQLGQIRFQTARAERKLSKALAAVQETVAATPFLGFARRAGTIQDGEISNMDTVVEALRRAMLSVYEGADVLRVSTVKKTMEILNLDQSVRFLARAGQLQLHVRSWGQRRDATEISRVTQ